MKHAQHLLPVESGLAGADRPLDILWSKFAGVTGAEEGCVRILFTSPDHGTGTTTVTTAVGLGLARNLKERVAMVETNFHAPAMATYLDLPPTPGLTDVLDGRAEATEAIRNSKVDGLYALTAGTPRAARVGELITPEARDLFRNVVADRQYVLIDAPPIVARPEVSVQLDFADWIVLVIRARSTRRGHARRAMRMIQETGARVLGVVVNRFQSDLPFGMGAGDWK